MAKEYSILLDPLTRVARHALLNEMGAQNWTFKGFIPGNNDLIFEREIPVEAKMEHKPVELAQEPQQQNKKNRR